MDWSEDTDNVDTLEVEAVFEKEKEESFKKTLPQECKECEQVFESETGLETHVVKIHGAGDDDEKEWDCDDCDFQGSNSKELMNHLKIKRHQPSKKVLSNKSEVKSCYTCGGEYTTYKSLMNQRREKHQVTQ